jgi:hypothetical protein
VFAPVKVSLVLVLNVEKETTSVEKLVKWTVKEVAYKMNNKIDNSDLTITFVL